MLSSPFKILVKSMVVLKSTNSEVEDILDSYQWIIDESSEDPDLKDDPLYKIYYSIKDQISTSQSLNDC